MRFEEQAAELHRLEAVALSLGLSKIQFEPILQEVTAAADVDGSTPADQLDEIIRQIQKRGCLALPSTMATIKSIDRAEEPEADAGGVELR